METKKVMIYTTEDNRIGIKEVKFNFAEGTKIRNKETGKIMISNGVFDLENSDAQRLAKAFRKLTRISGFRGLFWLTELTGYAFALQEKDFRRIDVW